jgi:hypothetical protein
MILAFFMYLFQICQEPPGQLFITSINKNITNSSMRIKLTIRKKIICSKPIFIVMCICIFIWAINTKYFYVPNSLQRRFSSSTQEIIRILCKPKIHHLFSHVPISRPTLCFPEPFYTTPLPSQPITSGVHQAGFFLKKNCSFYIPCQSYHP